MRWRAVIIVHHRHVHTSVVSEDLQLPFKGRHLGVIRFFADDSCSVFLDSTAIDDTCTFMIETEIHGK